MVQFSSLESLTKASISGGCFVKLIDSRGSKFCLRAENEKFSFENSPNKHTVKVQNEVNESFQLTHWGRHKCWHFPDNIFKCTLINENVYISIKI